MISRDQFKDIQRNNLVGLTEAQIEAKYMEMAEQAIINFMGKPETDDIQEEDEETYHE